MKKRIISSTLCGVLLVGSLTGCSAQEEKQDYFTVLQKGQGIVNCEYSTAVSFNSEGKSMNVKLKGKNVPDGTSVNIAFSADLGNMTVDNLSLSCTLSNNKIYLEVEPIWTAVAQVMKAMEVEDAEAKLEQLKPMLMAQLNITGDWVSIDLAKLAAESGEGIQITMPENTDDIATLIQDIVNGVLPKLSALIAETGDKTILTKTEAVYMLAITQDNKDVFGDVVKKLTNEVLPELLTELEAKYTEAEKTTLVDAVKSLKESLDKAKQDKETESAEDTDKPDTDKPDTIKEITSTTQCKGTEKDGNRVFGFDLKVVDKDNNDLVYITHLSKELKGDELTLTVPAADICTDLTDTLIAFSGGIASIGGGMGVYDPNDMGMDTPETLPDDMDTPETLPDDMDTPETLPDDTWNIPEDTVIIEDNVWDIPEETEITEPPVEDDPFADLF